MTLKREKPPEHLRPETAAWWASVVEDFELDTHHRMLLTLAGEAWDRSLEARESLAEHGLVFEDRFCQPRSRPEFQIERDCKGLFARLLRELALDVMEPGEEARPPRIVGRRGAGV